MNDSPDFDELFNPDLLKEAPKEASADERISQTSRIARGNERLKRQGEISDGFGKPKYGRVQKRTPWIVLGFVTGITIIVVVLIVR